MKEKEITVLKVEPLKEPCLCTLVNELGALQKAVSIDAPEVGLIEIIEIGNALGYQGETICLLCNEEGKLIGLTPNRRVGRDIICGTFYINGENKDGDLASLSLKATEFYTKHFRHPELIDPKDVEACIYTTFEMY